MCAHAKGPNKMFGTLVPSYLKKCAWLNCRNIPLSADYLHKAVDS